MYTLDENSSVKNLVDTFNKNKIGCIIETYMNSYYPVGIVSERDLVRNYDKIFNNKYLKVRNVMTKKIIFCNKNTS